MASMKLVCVFPTIILFGFSIAQKSSKVAIQQEYNCTGLYGRNADHTAMLREYCLALVKTKLYQFSKSFLENTSEAKLLKVRKSWGRKQRDIILNRSCPSRRNYFEHTPVNERSLSPYIPTITYDENRFPRYLVQQKCLCRGCINPKTGKEDTKVKSQEVTYRSTAFALDGSSYKHVQIDIVAGCTCSFY